MAKKIFKVLSVGGSIIVPPSGFDINFLKKFRDLILRRVQAGDKFVLVVGGGATCRNYQTAAKAVRPLTDIELDWLGIKTTWFNAEFIRLIFGKHAHKEVVTNPTNKLITNKPIIVAGGWKPGRSTDYDAVLLAKNLAAETVFNLSNVNFVYDKDPNKFNDARKITKTTWSEFRKIIGDKWMPGAQCLFDPKAAKLAQKLNLKVVFVKGDNLPLVDRVLNGGDKNCSVIF